MLIIIRFLSQGNPVEHPELPETVSRFSETVPNTNAANYGSRVDSSMGRNLSELQFRLIGHFGKRKIDQEINCNY